MTTDLTPGLLSQIMEGDPARAAECFDNMILGMRKFNIDTPVRISNFLAQVKWESGSLVYFAELADGTAYEGRADLGNTQPGDGPRFKGSGPLQLTGRSNFVDANNALNAMGINIDIVANPDLARTVQYGFLASCWWWGHDQFPSPNTNCNLVADNMGNIACGRAVNRGDPYSQYQAQDEQARIDAYNHVMQFGDLALPADASAPAPPAFPWPPPPAPTPAPTPTPTPAPPTVPEDDMFSDADRALLTGVNAALHAPAQGVTGPDGKPSNSAGDILAALLRQTEALINQSNVNKGAVLAAVVKAATAGGTPEQIAEAVGAELGK